MSKWYKLHSLLSIWLHTAILRFHDYQIYHDFYSAIPPSYVFGVP